MSDFSTRYEHIYNLLAAYIRPNVEHQNLLIHIHELMKNNPPELTRKLVDEFNALAEDESMDEAALAAEFNQDVDLELAIFSEETAVSLLNLLADYVTYLYEVAGVRGSDKWNRS